MTVAEQELKLTVDTSGLEAALRSTEAAFARAEEARVVSEPLTYARESPHSFYRDLALSEAGRDPQGEASQRLAQHRTEMRVELAGRELRTPEGAVFEQRVNPNRTEGQGGFFAPPLWLIQYFGSARRASRVIANLIPEFDLPLGVGSVRLPRLKTGTEVLASADGTPGASRDVVDSEVFSKCVAFRGISDWSLQSLEQSPVASALDWAIFTDLLHAYDFALESMIISGTGEGESFKGVLTEGTAVSYTGSTEATKIFPFLGQLMARIGNKRKMPPEAWFTTTARFGYMATSEDKQERPLLITDYVGNLSPAASLVGINLYFNDAIPMNLGAGGQQDVILLGRPKDLMLLESDEKTRVLMEPLSGDLQVRFEFHRYAACLFRYASGWSFLEGSGMEVPAEFRN